MNWDRLHRVIFLGIGGIGMSALARYFVSRGVEVCGYDKTKSPVTEALEKEGLSIFYTDDLPLYPTMVDLVIYTPAIPAGHAGLNWYREQGYTVLKRSEVLEILTRGRDTIAVAGTHGKTTITAMVTHLLDYCEIPCTAFIGGIANNFNSNFYFRSDKKMVVEADEYDRSFLRLHPNVGVVSAIDPDHLDIYGDELSLRNAFQTFSRQIAPDGVLILHESVAMDTAKLLCRVLTYGWGENADIQAKDMMVVEGQFAFGLYVHGEYKGRYELPIPGRYNVENALAAMTAAHCWGADWPSMQRGLKSFRGIHRRFEYVVRHADCTYIDDYAHHPKEIAALLTGIRQLYPGRQVLAIFQPHLYSRTRDLAQGFAESLALADQVILLPIYPAREEPVAGVSSEMIRERMPVGKGIITEKSNLLDALSAFPAEVIVSIGAGDIDRLVPDIANWVKKQVA